MGLGWSYEICILENFLVCFFLLVKIENYWLYVEMRIKVFEFLWDLGSLSEDLNIGCFWNSFIGI